MITRCKSIMSQAILCRSASRRATIAAMLALCLRADISAAEVTEQQLLTRASLLTASLLCLSCFVSLDGSTQI